MKRIIAFVLITLTIAVVIAGCVSGNNKPSTTTTTGTTTTGTAPGTTTAKPDVPVEKPTASEAMAAYLKTLLRENSGKNLTEIMGRLDEHPCFDSLRRSGTGYRVVGDLSVTDEIMDKTFWVGVYPGMSDEMIDEMARVIHEALKSVEKAAV